MRGSFSLQKKSKANSNKFCQVQEYELKNMKISLAKEEKGGKKQMKTNFFGKRTGNKICISDKAKKLRFNKK